MCIRDSPGVEWVTIVVRYPEVESVRQLLQFGDHIRMGRPLHSGRSLCESSVSD